MRHGEATEHHDSAGRDARRYLVHCDVGCGGSSHPASVPRTTSTTALSLGEARAGLRAAGLAWAKAYLTGTPEAIAALQGPECAGRGITPANRSAAVAEVEHLREGIKRFTGVSPNEIKIRGVRTRNVTATSGEAEVEYALPQAATGNDNWVTYELRQGQWKIADCGPPIGGSSVSATTPATVP
jgi:hypothetical protein